MKHKKAVIEALSRSNGERAIASYLLKRNPDLVLHAFGQFGNHGNYVLSEVRLGKSLRADFVIVQGFSGGWWIDFVELEPVVDAVLTKDRTPTRPLRNAQRQIADWRDYLRTEGARFHREIADETKNDLLKYSSGAGDPTTGAGHRLRDPDSFVDDRYHVVIGRRKLLSKATLTLRSKSLHDDQIDIATYDRIVDVAAEFDSAAVRSQQEVSNLNRSRGDDIRSQYAESKSERH